MKHHNNIINNLFINEDFFDDNTNIDTESITDDKFDDLNTEQASPEEKKAASNMKLIIAFSYDKFIDSSNPINSFIDNLLKSYDNLFSVFYMEENLNKHFSTRCFLYKNVYYKLKSNVNVNLFYRFLKNLISFFNKFAFNIHYSAYCVFFKYYPNEDNENHESAITLNSTSFLEGEQNTDYLIANIFTFNDLFDEYLKRFSLRKVINALKANSAIELSLKEAYDYLKKKNTLYVFLPIINPHGFSQAVPVSVNSINDVFIVEELLTGNGIKDIHLWSGIGGLERHYNQYKYSLSDYKESIKSDYETNVQTVEDKKYKGTFQTLWHMKPFYTDYKSYEGDLFKVPSIAIEITMNV